MKEIRLGKLPDYLDELSGTDRESGRWGFPLPSQPLVSGLAYCLNKAHPTTAEPASATAFA